MNEDIIILIAEDNRGHYILAEHCLRNAGFSNRIIWLTDGQHLYDFLYSEGNGPKLTSDHKYILLLDIRMPKIDGIQVLESIKNDENLRNIPVVVVSTSDNPTYVKRCKELGCSAYIVKPLGEDFIEAVQNTCQCI